MTLRASIQIALRSLAGNKLRSVLTMLGVIIGVGAVVSMVSIGAGARESVSQQVTALGSNLLMTKLLRIITLKAVQCSILCLL